MEHVQLSDGVRMSSEEEKDFDKEFSEIVSSKELKDISNTFKRDEVLTLKELLLVQQSLLETLGYVSDIIFGHMAEGEEILFMNDSVYHNLLGSIYKMSEDFVECMVEYKLDQMFDPEDFDEESDESDD